MEIGLAFGNVMRKLRKSRNLSQQELAKKAGLDRSFISLLERGERQPSLSTVFIIAQKLKIDPSVLIGQVHRMTQQKGAERATYRTSSSKL